MENKVTERSVSITITVEDEVNIDVDELYTAMEQDLPELVTAEEVLGFMKAYSENKMKVLEDWELLADPRVDVIVVDRCPNPYYHGDNVLFGSPPPQEMVRRTNASW